MSRGDRELEFYELLSWSNSSNVNRIEYFNMVENEQFSNFVDRLLGDCYNLYISGNTSKKNKFMEKLVITKNVLGKYAKYYYIHNLNKTTEEWDKLVKYTKEYNNFVDKLYRGFGRGNEEEFLRKMPEMLYSFCEALLFNEKNIRFYAKKYELSYNVLEKIVKEYAKNVLNKNVNLMYIAGDRYNDKALIQKFLGSSSKRIKYYDKVRGNYLEFMLHLMRRCYSYALNCKYDKDKMTEFGYELDLTYEEVYNYAKKYATLILFMDSKKFEEVVNGDVPSKTNNNLKLKNWLSTSSSRVELYDLLEKGNWINFNNKLLKYCYNFCMSVHMDAIKITEFCGYYDLDMDIMLNEFLKNGLSIGIDKEEIKRVVSEINISKCSKKYSDNMKWIGNILSKIENAMDSDTLVRIIETYGVSPGTLLKYVDIYIKLFKSSLNEDSKIKLSDSLKNRLKEYQLIDLRINSSYTNSSNQSGIDLIVSEEAKVKLKEQRENQRKEELIRKKEKEKLENERRLKLKQNRKKFDNLALNTELMMKKFVESGLRTKEEFCVKEGIKVANFNKLLLFCKKYMSDLYDTLDNIDDSHIYDKTKEEIKLINDTVRSGVDGRPFDLLDYYEITDKPIEELISIARVFYSSSELPFLIEFARKNYFPNTESKTKIMNDFYIINGRAATMNEKLAVIRFLEENNMPVNSHIFKLVLRKYGDQKYKLSEKKLIKVK